jgi:hypothetical protein
MRRLPSVKTRRIPVLVVATALFLTAQAAPTYASVPKIKTKLTSATSLKLQKHGSYYLYVAVTDGSAASTPLQDQRYFVVDEDGFTSAQIAEGPSTTNSYTTSTAGHEFMGARIPRSYSLISLAGSNSNDGPGSSLSTSVSFSVATSNTLVEVIGLGSSQQTSSLSGVVGLTVQETSGSEAVQLADATNLAPGPYTVTLTSSETAPDQDPNHAADVLAVFEFQKP